MTDFFSRISERALGSASKLRPILSPRYANHSFASEAIDPSITIPLGIKHALGKHYGPEIPQQTDEISTPSGDSVVKKISGPLIAGSVVRDSERPVMPASRAEGRRDQKLVSEDLHREMETNLLPEEGQNNPTELIKLGSIFNENKNFDNSQSSISTKHEPIQDKPLLPLKQQLDKVSSREGKTAGPHQYRKTHAGPSQTSNAANQSIAPQEAPVIKVNIGRIDVRAVHQVPSPSKDSKVSSSPALSLDDYLQQRRQGER